MTFTYIILSISPMHHKESLTYIWQGLPKDLIFFFNFTSVFHKIQENFYITSLLAKFEYYLAILKHWYKTYIRQCTVIPNENSLLNISNFEKIFIILLFFCNIHYFQVFLQTKFLNIFVLILFEIVLPIFHNFLFHLRCKILGEKKQNINTILRTLTRNK